jgi:pyrimidine operon attenuation protein/uracil phosphoribosyltransferase
MALNKEPRQHQNSGVLLDADDISRITSRIAHEIIERTANQDIVLMGIPSRGVPFAKRISNRINAIQNQLIAVGSLDITLHRDDLRLKAPRALQQTLVPDSGIDNKVVILVDDVLFSGRTIRAALDALSEIGRPAAVQLAVLVDRGHRELPIRADYVGKNIPTAKNQSVQVKFTETDDIDSVVIANGDLV